MSNESVQSANSASSHAAPAPKKKNVKPEQAKQPIPVGQKKDYPICESKNNNACIINRRAIGNGII